MSDSPSRDPDPRRIEPTRAAPGRWPGAPPTEGPGNETTTEFPAAAYPAQARSFPFLGPADAAGDLGRFGPYRVVALLGEGGMGYVFRAEDEGLDRPIALKVMRPEVAAGSNARERFLREGRAAAAVKSDYVAVIHSVGEANGVPYLAMEYLEGCTLEDWLRAGGGTASVKSVLKVAKDVLRGLAAAHEKGLVHRDIKPSNLWVEKPGGRVKVLDFGLTRPRGGSENLTQPGAVVGTPAFMAPEQAAGRAVDPRADLFSLGCVLYRMLAGDSPFARDSVFATLHAVGFEDPPPVRTLPCGVPPGLADLIDRLLAKDPSRRPASAKAALADVSAIGKAVRGEETPAAVPPPAPRPAPPAEPPPAPGEHGPSRFRRALDTARSEVAASAAVTAEHARRAKAHGALLLRRKQLHDRLPDELAALGQAAAAAGMGDDDLRRQLAPLDERIRNVRAANGSYKPLEVERRGVLIRLAEPFAGADDVPPQLRGPHAAVRATRAELAEIERQLATGSGLIPKTIAGKVRLAAGVAVPLLVLVVIGYVVFGGKPKEEPPPPEPAAGPAVVAAVVGQQAILREVVGLVVCGTRETDAGGNVIEVPTGTGTGFVVTPDGVVFTNKHVVEKTANLRNAKHTLDDIRKTKKINVVPTVWVFFGKQKYVAEIRHVSEKYDFAILKVDRTFDRVFALRREATVPQGSKVYALGYPGAANDAMSEEEAAKLKQRRESARPKVEQYFLETNFDYVLYDGIVSKMRDINEMTWVQHNTVIHPGNSGGPLVSEDGVVVGINTIKHKDAVGISLSLGLPQLEAEAGPHAAGLVWK